MRGKFEYASAYDKSFSSIEKFLLLVKSENLGKPINCLMNIKYFYNSHIGSIVREAKVPAGGSSSSEITGLKYVDWNKKWRTLHLSNIDNYMKNQS